MFLCEEGFPCGANWILEVEAGWHLEYPVWLVFGDPTHLVIVSLGTEKFGLLLESGSQPG